MLVPVTINGVPKKLLLTTASDFSTLNAGTVKELDLEVLHTYRSKLIDAAGNASRILTTVCSRKSQSAWMCFDAFTST
jgi:ABC-type enterochelin transport system substrate-binding protein